VWSTGDERRAAADALRYALGLLEKKREGQLSSVPLLALSRLGVRCDQRRFRGQSRLLPLTGAMSVDDP